MLIEIKNVKQIPGEAPRRWFSCSDMDLIIWQKPGEQMAFQLSYDKTANEHAVSWSVEKGLLHHKVDDGENRPGHYKATPLLVANGEVDLQKIRQLFEENALKVDPEIRQQVLLQLAP